MSARIGQLLIAQEGAPTRTVALERLPLTIGRTESSDLHLPGLEISRHHAEVRASSLGLVVVDVGSTYGTVVDGKRIAAGQETPLINGHSFQIGLYTLTYSAADQTVELVLPAPPSEASDDSTGSAPHHSALPLVAGHRTLQHVPTPGRPWRHAPSGYLNDLPVIFHDTDENNFLGRFLLGLETIWEPLEQRQDYLALYLDPATCPEPFLPWLLGWFGLTLDPPWGSARARQVLARANRLIQQRGTPAGLKALLEAYSGATVTITEDHNTPFVFHIRVTPAPGDAVERRAIERLILAHKPAHAGYILEVTP